MSENELSQLVIGLCINIHKKLGAGLFESVYEQCLCYELDKQNIKYTSQQAIPVVYKGINIPLGFRSDIIIENKLIIEIKSIESLQEIHKTQLLTYLRLTDIKLGLLINFNVVVLKDGIKRIVNNL